MTMAEQKFLTNYIRLGNLTDAIASTPELNCKSKNRSVMSAIGGNILRKPNVQAEYKRILEMARQETIATAKEVMEYFTKVMRGEEKDQFGLDAPLSEKTRAAQELAKRTIDIENREAGKSDQLVSIKLDWSRD